MDKEIGKAISHVMQTMINFPETRQAASYISPKLVVRASRRGVGRPRRGDNTEVVLTIGRPNFVQRSFIKSCQKSGEVFPVKKMQLKFFPVKKK